MCSFHYISKEPLSEGKLVSFPFVSTKIFFFCFPHSISKVRQSCKTFLHLTLTASIYRVEVPGDLCYKANLAISTFLGYLFLHWVLRCFDIFRIQVVYQMYGLKVFSPYLWFVFSFSQYWFLNFLVFRRSNLWILSFPKQGHKDFLLFYSRYLIS